jgi:2-polyprenyl-6-methoxyphenol hydroxylase-like FAD-dependent oxidoreductase
VIVGAGVGGLSTAIALSRIGAEVTVLERLDGPDQLQAGSGLTIWSNASKALARLDLADEVQRIGTPMTAFENRTRTGELMTTWPVAEISARVGAPTVNLTRAALHRVLGEALDPVTIHHGAQVVSFADDGAAVEVTAADERRWTSDIVVGADGIGSTVRHALNPDWQPRYAGYVAWRGLLPFEHARVPHEAFQQFWGPGMRFAFYYVGDQDLYWIAIANAPAGATDNPGRVCEDLVERYRGWADPITEIIAATAEQAILRTDISDVDPAATWGRGRATLLGDAAHAMTFNVGQGACTAIEDAVVLADRLDNADDKEAALRAYEAESRARTLPLQRLGRRIGKMAMWSNPVATGVRDFMWRHVVGPSAAKHLENQIAREI